MLAVDRVDPFGSGPRRYHRPTVGQRLDNLQPGSAAEADGNQHCVRAGQLVGHRLDRADQIQAVDAD